MNTNVIVSGIPRDVKLRKLLPLFSKILNMEISDFRLSIRSSEGPVKDVLLTLRTHSDAKFAEERLDSFVYNYSNSTYVFTAKIDVVSKRNNKNRRKTNDHNRQFEQYEHQYKNWREKGFWRNRSCSPDLVDKSSRLDMQIEILRKQRLIIEEERKLLEENRKLDQLKMITFNNKTMPVFNNTYDDFEMSELSSNPSEKKFEPKQLSFYRASGVLLKKMNMFIQKHSLPNQRKALTSRLRSILKKRMAQVIAADGQGIYQTHKVIMLYRMLYPPSEDEELVKETIKYFKKGLWTDTTVEASTESVIATNTCDGTESYAEDQENATAKETTISGDDTNISEKIENKSRKMFEQKRLQYHKASATLIREMNVHIDKHSPTETRKLLIEYLRSTLKKRLATVLDGRPVYQTPKIIELYRSQHPDAEDEDFIKQLLKDIDEGNDASDEQKSAALDDTIPQDEKLTAEEATHDLGQLTNSENTDISKNNENISNVEKNIDKVEDLQKYLDNQNIKSDTVEPNTGDELYVNNEENINEMVDTQNDLDNIEKDSISNLEENSKVDNDNITNVIATEAKENGADTVNSEEDNRGVKRKNDEIKDSSIKVPKIDVMVIGFGDTNDNDLN